MERSQLAALLGPESHAPEARTRIIYPESELCLREGLAWVLAHPDRKLFLADPLLSLAERLSLEALAREGNNVSAELGWFCLPTGGTRGHPRFCRHDSHTLAAAVDGFRQYFGFSKVNAIGLLPLHHVSGCMAWMRCLLTGGCYRHCRWRSFFEAAPPVFDAEGAWTLSLVPTQLQTLLSSPPHVAWLKRFTLVFLGGGPAWPSLLERAALAQIPLSLCYGMTETAAMVSAQLPGEFPSGDRSCGSALPHVQWRLDDDARLWLRTPSLHRGYFPGVLQGGEWPTADRCQFDARGALHVLGRLDEVLISGGKKLNPLELEDAILRTGRVRDVCVLGLPDEHWGQVQVAFVPGPFSQAQQTELLEELRASLSPYKLPKKLVAVFPWPRTDQGKIPRSQLLAHLAKE